MSHDGNFDRLDAGRVQGAVCRPTRKSTTLPTSEHPTDRHTNLHQKSKHQARHRIRRRPVDPSSQRHIDRSHGKRGQIRGAWRVLKTQNRDGAKAVMEYPKHTKQGHTSEVRGGGSPAPMESVPQSHTLTK